MQNKDYKYKATSRYLEVGLMILFLPKYILKAIKNATGTSVFFPVNISFIHYVLVLTSVPNVGERFTKT